MSSFLTAHQHILGYLVPYHGVVNLHKRGYNHRFIYSLLDAVPPIHAESSHVATDKVPSM